MCAGQCSTACAPTSKLSAIPVLGDIMHHWVEPMQVHLWLEPPGLCRWAGTCWVAATCATEAFSTTCAVHIEDCEGVCLVVVHAAQWQSTGCLSQVSWVQLPAIASIFSLPHCSIPTYQHLTLPHFFTFHFPLFLPQHLNSFIHCSCPSSVLMLFIYIAPVSWTWSCDILVSFPDHQYWCVCKWIYMECTEKVLWIFLVLYICLSDIINASGVDYLVSLIQQFGHLHCRAGWTWARW